MLDIRPVLLVIGILLIVLGLAMLFPAMVDLAYDNRDWRVFMAASFTTLFIGLAMWLSNRGVSTGLSIRQAFLVTTLTWVFIAAFGALPLYWSEANINFSEAYFEAMSGLTTTGATVISGLDTLPPGILLWRSILQWLGGLGIIVMAVAVLPMLQIGGMQMFRTEAFETSEKILPRAAAISGSLIIVYVFLTGSAIFAYFAAGMSFFDAVNHGMTTIATGGFSTKDASMGHFNNQIQWIGTFFMILGGLPFILFVKMMQGSWGALLRDQQVQGFLRVLLVLCGGTAIYLVMQGYYGGWDAARLASFNMVSIISGTGYATTDYGLWGSFAVTLFFIATFIGGCTGSTSCGLKIMRWQIMSIALSQHLKRVAYPSGVFNPYYNGQRLSDNVIASVMSFVFLFFLSFIVLALGLGMMGLDPLTAISGAATAISNVGPGLGPVIGPSGNFAPLPDAAKWLLSFGMILGRLEVFAVLILFMPGFWKN